jgi:hypothetical protein
MAALSAAAGRKRLIGWAFRRPPRGGDARDPLAAGSFFVVESTSFSDQPDFI